MKNFIKAVLGGLCLSLAMTSAQAEDRVGDNYVSFLGSAVKTDSDRRTDDGIEGAALKIGGIISEYWNAEIELGSLNLDWDAPGGRTYDQTYVGANALNVYNRDGGFQPFFLGGLGFVDNDLKQRDDETNFYTNLGVGAFVPIFDDRAKLRGEALYRWENADSNFTDWILNLGVSIPFGKAPAPAPVVAPPPEPAPPADSDGDGVFDDADRCPNTLPGVKVDANGCERDSDGDGVGDSRDKCPNTPAGAKVDKDGCQIIIKLPGVNFRTNSDQLLDGADTVLDEAAQTLADNPGLRVEVAGHTDSDGDADYNLNLSQRRAETVRAYLIGKNINADRMTARGYGEERPVAENTTRDGKRANRRVELRVLE
jgi:OOP family OmpA-OmpF porin